MVFFFFFVQGASNFATKNKKRKINNYDCTSINYQHNDFERMIYAWSKKNAFVVAFSKLLLDLISSWSDVRERESATEREREDCHVARNWLSGWSREQKLYCLMSPSISVRARRHDVEECRGSNIIATRCRRARNTTQITCTPGPDNCVFNK